MCLLSKNSPTVRIFKNFILMGRVVSYPLNMLYFADFHCRIFFLIQYHFFSVLFLVRFDISLSSSYQKFLFFFFLSFRHLIKRLNGIDPIVIFEQFFVGFFWSTLFFQPTIEKNFIVFKLSFICLSDYQSFPLGKDEVISS